MSTEKNQKSNESMGLKSYGSQTNTFNYYFTGDCRLYLSHITKVYDFHFNTTLEIEDIKLQEYVLIINPGSNCKNTTQINIYRNETNIIFLLNDDTNDKTGNYSICHNDIEVYKWIHRVHFVKTDNITIASLFPGYNQYVFLQLLFRYLNVSDIVLKQFKNGTKFDLLSVYLERSWLTDEAINNYFNLINNRSKNNYIYAFPTQFWLSLVWHGYDSAKKMAKKVDLFSFKKLFFPININSNHWALLCFNLEKKQIVYFDSLVESKEINMHRLTNYGLQFITNYYKEINNTDPNFGFDWEIIDGDSPIQDNTDDCGVYVCVNGEFYSRDLPSKFCHNDAILLRQRITFEILLGRLIFDENGLASLDYHHYDVNTL